MNVIGDIGRWVLWRRGVKLTDEHIIPLGLGGTDVLRAACCVPCQRAVNDGYESRLGGPSVRWPGFVTSSG